MPWRRDVRASDLDREQCAAALARHYVAGRIALDELEGRLDRARLARTTGELGGLVADLPRPARLAGFGRWVDRFDRLALRAHAATYVAVNGVLVGMWELVGGGEFWPAYALVPSTALVAWHAGGSWTVRRALGAPRGRRMPPARPR